MNKKHPVYTDDWFECDINPEDFVLENPNLTPNKDCCNYSRLKHIVECYVKKNLIRNKTAFKLMIRAGIYKPK